MGGTGGAGGMGGMGGAGNGGNGGNGGSGGIGPGQCRSAADCENGQMCLSPGQSPGCGACYIPQNPCTTDTQCALMGANMICDPAPCACNGDSECHPGCASDADCEGWQFCSPGHRCTPDVCATDADCPANFVCAGVGCARELCASDAQCDDLCVNGQCFDAAGTCMFPPP
jgi:hypothetical protein